MPGWFFVPPRTPLLKRYLTLQACLILWMVCKVFKTIAPQVTLRWIFVVIQYFGIAFLGPCFLIFIFHLVYRRDLPRGLQRILFFLSFLILLVVGSNPLHHQFYSTFDFYGDTFGPLFYIHALIMYLLILIGIGLLLSGILRERIESLQEKLLSLAALAPLLFNFLYITGVLEPLFDYTPIAISISLLLLSLAAFHRHFLGVLPIAYETVISGIENPFIILDRNARFLYGNPDLSGPVNRPCRRRDFFF